MIICWHNRHFYRIGTYCVIVLALMDLSSAWGSTRPARSKAFSGWGIKSTISAAVETSKKTPPTVVETSAQLRAEILDLGQELKQVQVDVPSQNFTADALFDHNVVQLILRRAREGSKPGQRAAGDTSSLALAIEGGGMRGAVSAGMAAALVCLGLADSFDSVYGSSAGSVVGAYLVSRQMCMDVYLDILPTAKKKFVCLKRLSLSVCMTALDTLFSTLFRRSPSRPFSSQSQPGMNISFVLDGIMHPDQGVRPLDLAALLDHDLHQPLRVVSSCSEDGRLVTRCFGRSDFLTAKGPNNRNGIYACLQASMTVPGAAGPPVQVTTQAYNETKSYFDAFCCEPLPYRSAIEEGATHCLVLCSRPDGFRPHTKPTLYEMGVAPMYFLSHGEKELAKFFASGGQQYLYAEDLLTLSEGQFDRGDGVRVPPTTVLYGIDRNDDAAFLAHNRHKWKKAHLLPLKVPYGTTELATLEQGQMYVVEHGIRAGFAAVYDIFAPCLDLEISRKMSGHDVARIIFPDSEDSARPDDFLNSCLPAPFLQVFKKCKEAIRAFRNTEEGKSRIVRLASREVVQKVLNSLPGLQSGSFDVFRKAVLISHNLL